MGAQIIVLLVSAVVLALLTKAHVRASIANTERKKLLKRDWITLGSALVVGSLSLVLQWLQISVSGPPAYGLGHVLAAGYQSTALASVFIGYHHGFLRRAVLGGGKQDHFEPQKDADDVWRWSRTKTWVLCAGIAAVVLGVAAMALIQETGESGRY